MLCWGLANPFFSAALYEALCSVRVWWCGKVTGCNVRDFRFDVLAVVFPSDSEQVRCESEPTTLDTP